MTGRLSIREFEFLQKILQAVEDAGDTAIKTGTFSSADLIALFGADRPRIIDTTNRIRILKEKINQQAMN